MKDIRLKFYGYTWEDYAFQISSLRGLYVIYKGQLDSEGFINLFDILYMGYHNGIYEMYDNGCMTQIRDYVNNGERIFLSYAEVPEGEDGRELEAILKNAIESQYISDIKVSNSSNKRLVCEGSCALFPKELL